MYTYETKKKRGKIVDLSRCSMKKIRELIVFTAFLVVALWKFDVVIEVLKSIWKIVFPFALGGAIVWCDSTAYADYGKSDDEYFRFYSTDAKLDSRIFT